MESSDEERYKLLIENMHKAQMQGSNEDKIAAYIAISEYEYNCGMLEKAKVHLKKVLELDSNYSDVNFYLALIELSLSNKTSDATKYLERELKINPDNKNAKEILEKLHIKSNLPFGTITVFILCVLTFVAFYPNPTYSELLKFGLSDYNFGFATLVSSIYMHANLMHFAFNMVILILFGLHLEKFIGTARFVFIFFVCAIIGNLLQMMFSPANAFVLGVSGGLFGIFGAIVMREPLLNIRVLGLFKVPIIILFGGIFIVSYLVSNFFSGGVMLGEISHIMGFLIGMFLTGLFYRNTMEVFYNWVVISLGFVAITFSLRNFISVYYEYISVNDFNFVLNDVLIASGSLLLGVFLIFYSYGKLKFINKMSEGDVR